MTDRDTITRTRARTPGGGGVISLHGGAQSSLWPDTVRDNRVDPEVHKGRMQTGRRTADAGSRLKLPTTPGRHRLKSQPSSRTGENPPYGMIGRIEETSASFEARYAPRSYPTRRPGWVESVWQARDARHLCRF